MIIDVKENNLIPVYKILGCKPSDLSKYPTQYILSKVREYYSNLK